MSKSRYSVNNWLLDHANGAIVHRKSGEIRRLGEYQLKLLDCLIQHAGQTLSRNELTNLVWERRVIGDNSLSNAIHALRAALEDDGKQQRVIKTIPKKGYLLDLEYCQPLEPVDDITPPSAPVLVTTKLPVAKTALLEEFTEPTLVNNDHPLTSIPDPPNKSWKFTQSCWPILTLLLLMCVILLSGWVFFYHGDYDDMNAQEQEKNQYSNIRVFRIAAAVNEINAEDILKFNSTLKMLNQKLITHDAWMTVYYRADEQVLNYTFSLETTCANQQLAMTLYHWRTDNQKLTSTIYNETERKLNEMAPCKKS